MKRPVILNLGPETEESLRQREMAVWITGLGQRELERQRRWAAWLRGDLQEAFG